MVNKVWFLSSFCELNIIIILSADIQLLNCVYKLLCSTVSVCVCVCMRVAHVWECIYLLYVYISLSTWNFIYSVILCHSIKIFLQRWYKKEEKKKKKKHWTQSEIQKKQNNKNENINGMCAMNSCVRILSIKKKRNTAAGKVFFICLWLLALEHQ